MTKDYEKSRIAVDGVIFTLSNNNLKIFLKKREKSPFENKFELPGGLVKENETAEEALSAFKKMQKRNIIKIPYASILTDGGSSFKGSFHKYLYDNGVNHRVARVGRHHQLSNVDSLCRQLGSIFNGIMNKKEEETGKVMEWRSKALPRYQRLTKRAEALIREILDEIADPAARAIADRAFRRHPKTGELSASRLVDLVTVEIADPRWQRATQAIRESLRVAGTATYFRAYRRERADKPWEQVVIDFSGIAPAAPRVRPAPPVNAVQEGQP
jgi:8-oxo-dGTP pyrophosphatase MutT (NUDIX family)